MFNKLYDDFLFYGGFEQWQINAVLIIVIFIVVVYVYDAMHKGA